MAWLKREENRMPSPLVVCQSAKPAQNGTLAGPKHFSLRPGSVCSMRPLRNSQNLFPTFPLSACFIARPRWRKNGWRQKTATRNDRGNMFFNPSPPIGHHAPAEPDRSSGQFQNREKVAVLSRETGSTARPSHSCSLVAEKYARTFRKPADTAESDPIFRILQA